MFIEETRQALVCTVGNLVFWNRGSQIFRIVIAILVLLSFDSRMFIRPPLLVLLLISGSRRAYYRVFEMSPSYYPRPNQITIANSTPETTYLVKPIAHPTTTDTRRHLTARPTKGANVINQSSIIR